MNKFDSLYYSSFNFLAEQDSTLPSLIDAIKKGDPNLLDAIAAIKNNTNPTTDHLSSLNNLLNVYKSTQTPATSGQQTPTQAALKTPEYSMPTQVQSTIIGAKTT